MDLGGSRKGDKLKVLLEIVIICLAFCLLSSIKREFQHKGSYWAPEAHWA